MPETREQDHVSKKKYCGLSPAKKCNLFARLVSASARSRSRSPVWLAGAATTQQRPYVRRQEYREQETHRTLHASSIMALPQAAYKDRQFLAVIGDEVRMPLFATRRALANGL